MAFDLSSRMELCSRQETERLRRHLVAMGLPTGVEQIGLPGLTPEVMLHHMRQDKKVTDGRLTFVLARGIGRAFVERDVAEDTVMAMLAAALTTHPAEQI